MIAPMLARPSPLSEIGRYVVDSNWALEQKLDGHRVMLVRPGTSRMRVLSRNGTTYTKPFPTAVRSWQLPAGIPEDHLLQQLVLDGELVGSLLWVFDVLAADGHMDYWTLLDRRRVLEALLGELSSPFRLVPQARTAEEKEKLLFRAAEENLEGVIAKRLDSSYRHGARSPLWLKAKFTATADLVVVGVRDDGHNSVAVGVTQDGGKSFRAIGRCSLDGKPAVKIGDVVEVRYLYVPDRSSPRLFQPTLLRIRDDKSVAECDGSDLRYTNRDVLSSL